MTPFLNLLKKFINPNRIKKDSVIYLDLNEITLLGWEEKKSIPKIENIIKRIKNGEEFPPVPILKIDNFTYELIACGCGDAFCVSDGGHHRAIAHYIENVPLKCIYKGRHSNYYKYRFCEIPIGNSILEG